MFIFMLNIVYFIEFDYEYIYEFVGKVVCFFFFIVGYWWWFVLEDFFIFLDVFELDVEDLFWMNLFVCVEIGLVVFKLLIILEGIKVLIDLLFEFLKSWFWGCFSIYV